MVDTLRRSANACGDGSSPARADPRFFTFADGTAGVFLETTGDYYRLTEESVYYDIA